VPTWTLPFAPVTATASSTPAPGTPTALPNTPAPPTETFTVVPAAVTETPLPSPTARPGIDPTLGASSPDPSVPLEIAVPAAMPQLHLDKDIVNILLLGRDTDRSDRTYRTDVMIVVSINKDANAVTLLTIPRDLFVYIPGWTMNRINTAAAHGDAIGYPGGGAALLEQTILYNLGIPIHGWARVDFQGFKNIVDTVGGVDVPVTCAMQDWRLKEPGLDQQNADNWQLYTVTPGVQHMEGDLGLWYARSRKRSSDFDRSRRQHQVLRAIFDKALRLQMVTKVPELYNQYLEIVDTDLGLGDLLQFVPMAPVLDKARIKSRFIGRDQVFPYTTSAGAAVLLPNRDAIAGVLSEAIVAPSNNVLARAALQVEVWNGTANADWGALAADNLAWEGITPILDTADSADHDTTLIYDFTTSAKGSQVSELQRLFRVKAENVIAAPDAQAAYPYRVVLGADFDSCVRPSGSIITITPTPRPGAVPQSEATIHAAAVLQPPPKIDGDLTEWANLPYPLAEPIAGAADWEGPSDLAGTYNIAWDADNLYIAIEVSDSAFIQLGTGQTMDHGDSLEIWFDSQLTADGSSHTLSDDDFRLGLSPGNLTSPVGGPEAYLWLPEKVARPAPEVLIGARLVPGGYAMEIAIPWKLFHNNAEAGQSFGFAMALNDDDTPGSPEQQTQATNRKGQKLADPTTWGILFLDSAP
jgi:LCP family protein required for cell wall assembly